jgi:hypothetical protein
MKNNWKSMDTAPLDGTLVNVVLYDGVSVTSAFYDSSVWGHGWVKWCSRSDAEQVTPILWDYLPEAPPLPVVMSELTDARLAEEKAIHSARYLLEDLCVGDIVATTGLPAGVVEAALENIFPERYR